MSRSGVGGSFSRRRGSIRGDLLASVSLTGLTPSRQRHSAGGGPHTATFELRHRPRRAVTVPIPPHDAPASPTELRSYGCRGPAAQHSTSSTTAYG